MSFVGFPDITRVSLPQACTTDMDKLKNECSAISSVAAIELKMVAYGMHHAFILAWISRYGFFGGRMLT